MTFTSRENIMLFYIFKPCIVIYIRDEDQHDAHFFLINLLKPTSHVMHQYFNIQQLYVLPTLYLCVLYLSENKQRLLPLRA